MGCACVKQAAALYASSLQGKASLYSSKRHSETSDKTDLPQPVDGRKKKSHAKQEEHSGDARTGVGSVSKRRDRRAHRTDVPGNLPKQTEGEQVAAGWPSWLSAVAGESIKGWIPRRADSFEKLDKIGQGTYSNVYKARDLMTGKIVALKKVRFDNLEPESVKFMAREILVLRRLDHPNVVKLEGLVTSRMSCSLYLVFEYMEHDLAGLAACPEIKFTEAQVKCYMHQLLSGLEHCHSRNVLHRDIKGSNLLLDNSGILKIADFGLATVINPDQKQPLTSRVVTLWYRAPELLLGATDYGAAVDLWSTGCILAELLAGKPILPGRTEVEQLHKIFKLCGSPSEDYWKRLKPLHASMFKLQQPYQRCIRETYKNFPAPALDLLDKLLAIEPSERGSASLALSGDFFTTEPLACDPSSLPQYPPSKEMDAKLRDEEARRQRAAAGRSRADTSKRALRDRAHRAVPAPGANAEMPANIQARRWAMAQSQGKSKSEKFPPAHEDGVVGFPLEPSRPLHGSRPLRHMVPTMVGTLSGPMSNSEAGRGHSRRKKKIAEDGRMAPPRPHSRSSGMNTTDFSQSGDFSSIASISAAKGTVPKSRLRSNSHLGNTSFKGAQKPDKSLDSDQHDGPHTKKQSPRL
ncbi:hypothetical protein KP509_19G042000 [Ceratopteris richardii]|uniref:Protein kinase domain-containing protein n=1 Tax=Ceratopteris richardii TaxID=49495 RepID=A0A8T2SLL2_CERRI|nr:hypothetical protein KP509_19G042000 [Ceratopteris richardii]